MPRRGFEPTPCEWRAHRLVNHCVNRSNASVVLHCYNFVSDNDHVRMREGQKCRRNTNLAPRLAKPEGKKSKILLREDKLMKV